MKRLNERFATDTIFSDIKSPNKNVCAKVFNHKVGFSAVYHIQTGFGDMIGQSYKDFCHDYGVLEHPTFYGAIAHIGSDKMFMKKVNTYGTRYHV